MEHDDWDAESVFDWLAATEHNGIYDYAAAEILCATLMAVADGNSALAGGPTDLPSVADVYQTKDPTPDQVARWRESIENIDLPKRELLLYWCDDEDGSLVRHLLKTLEDGRAHCAAQGEDWWRSDHRTAFLNRLAYWVSCYRQRFSEDQ
jgi:hypothetical protein